MKTFYRKTYNSYQAGEDRRLMAEAGLDVRSTVMYSDKYGNFSYLTFAYGEPIPEVFCPLARIQ